MKKFNFKLLFICIIIPLATGALAGFITKNSMDVFNSINKPPLSPPAILFPIVWTVLYILMGVSLYLVLNSFAHNDQKKTAIKIFALQLAFNFVWPLLFFGLSLYLLSFVWLLILIVLIVLMIKEFAGISKLAAYLQIPYLVWVVFAGYLNLMIFLLNM